MKTSKICHHIFPLVWLKQHAISQRSNILQKLLQINSYFRRKLKWKLKMDSVCRHLVVASLANPAGNGTTKKFAPTRTAAPKSVIKDTLKCASASQSNSFASLVRNVLFSTTFPRTRMTSIN